ncbi:MAG: neutral/alkaline non-lysosomal ceramidase N-terminal domain-containing protein [Lentisphaeria bacterium]|nr:neutral/alkaline non-lysosomal ceramidase N-terminal domain-containing protein [Lentisphaeria bacterium]
MSLQAGVGTRDISPRQPLFLVGYPHVDRISSGIHDPLFASALCLRDGDDAILSVAVDILFVAHRTARACRQAISDRTGIPSENILISATHTHSGPVTSEMLSWRDDPTVPGPDTSYMARFEQGIVEAAVEAAESATDAQIAVTTAHVEGVGGNRLAEDGVRDAKVGLLYVRRLDGTPFALQMVYSMHPTVLHEDSALVSADFPAYTRLHLGTVFPGLRVLYHNGSCGNLSPRYHVKGQTFEEANRLGTHLGIQVAAALTELSDRDFSTSLSLGAKRVFVDLPPRRFCSVEEAERELEEAVAEYEQLKREKAPHGPVRTAECTVFGAEERVTLAQAQASGDTDRVLEEYLPVEVQVLRAGDAFLVGFPGECFVEYSLQLKEQVPGAFVISLANGELQGYIPTPEAVGYEARLSFFEPAAGDVLVSTALELIDGLG